MVGGVVGIQACWDWFFSSICLLFIHILCQALIQWAPPLPRTALPWGPGGALSLFKQFSVESKPIVCLPVLKGLVREEYLETVLSLVLPVLRVAVPSSCVPESLEDVGG